MKRLTFVAAISTLALAAAGPAIAAPGGGHGGGATAHGNVTTQGSMTQGNRGGMKGDINAQGMSRTRGSTSVNSNMVTGSRIPMKSDVTTSTRVKGGANATTGTRSMGNIRFGADITGHAVVDSGGATIGTVTGVTTKGNGSVRTVQVTLTNGQIITLAPNSLNLTGDVLTTNSLTSNVKSQGAEHANINGLIHASPNSALASAGVTSLTGLNTGLTVNNSGGTAIGTVNSIVTNQSGAVIAIRVDLAGGGTAIIPATSLSMDGTTVVTSSTQF